MFRLKKKLLSLKLSVWQPSLSRCTIKRSAAAVDSLHSGQEESAIECWHLTVGLRWPSPPTKGDCCPTNLLRCGRLQCIIGEHKPAAAGVFLMCAFGSRLPDHFNMMVLKEMRSGPEMPVALPLNVRVRVTRKMESFGASSEYSGNRRLEL